MQDDKILFSEKVPAGKRTYFIDLMENFKGHKYVKFTESRANNGEFIRHTVRIFQEDFSKIFDAFDKLKSTVQNSAPPVQESKKDEEGDLSF